MTPLIRGDTGPERTLDKVALANAAITANNTYNSQINYTGNYALEGNIHYRTIDTQEAFGNNIRHVYRGTSSEDFQADRMQIILNDPSNNLSGTKREITHGSRFLKGWDSAVHGGSSASNVFNQGSFAILHVRGVSDGITADNVRNRFDQPDLLPIIFERSEYAPGGLGVLTLLPVS